MNDDRNTRQPRHGWVDTPPSRGSRAMELGFLLKWEVAEMEGGKNFPDTVGGKFRYFEGDVESATPPRDGFILSGGHEDGYREDLNLTNAELLVKYPASIPGWVVLPVEKGTEFKVHWEYMATHVTRGYRWFITKDNWDESVRITRDQLDPGPFAEWINPDKPFHQGMEPLKDLSVTLPDKTGHHVIILLWIVADTGNAFYQAFDVNFVEPASKS
ncbi:chitin-binding protein [Pseudomonas asturiensis]|uniref:Chitin-binding protein n=1 Tax=Pseudomonas asturiensis TaxID=1190415 RepID=A0A1M7KC08_9PSED|nr:lytic polysaccharide monooxygenase auxiliary activity family 9 protein [Pseudomonas asturiensis]SHM62820.1 chitin-binding protein [Pseudomonas asturiensis]